MSPILFFLVGLAFGAGLLFILHLIRSKSWQSEREVASARLSDAEAALTREREDFGKALANMQLTFKGISSEVLKETRDEFLKQAEPRLTEQVRPLKEALTRYEEALREIERKREHAYGGLKGVIDEMRKGHVELSRETVALVGALKSPSARGRWGELTL
jgi:DNA recombination protein RmuC